MNRGLASETLTSFLEKLALPSPTPGGGSAAALAGALAAALVEMVAALTLKKSSFSSSHFRLGGIARSAKRWCRRLLSLVDEDAAAYDAVVSAYRDRNEEKIKSALKKASLIPLRTFLLCQKASQAAEELRSRGRKSALSDVQTARLLARAGAQAAKLNVLANLKSLRKFPKTGRFISRLGRSLRGNCGGH